MFSFRKVINVPLCLVRCETCKQIIRTVKRKYPIDPNQVNELPVFQYKVSKKTYKRAFVWGNGQSGALGIKGLVDKKISILKTPRRLSFAEYFEVRTAAAGFGFSLYGINSNTETKLYGTGLNTDGQIGYHEVRSNHPLETIFHPQPISLPLRDPKNSQIRKISAGRAHAVVVTDEGVFTLGSNNFGQCGRKVINDEDYFRGNFIHYIQDIDGKKVIDVECGQDHSLFLTSDGSVYSCGWGADGQTGLGHFQSTDRLSRVVGDILNEKIVKLACRSDFVLALNDKGQVFGWGNTEYGQLALPNGEQQLAHPTYLNHLKSLEPIRSIATGGTFCLIANEKGDVYSWGYGLLGTSATPELSTKPLKIPSTLFGRNDFQPNTKVVKVACGLNYAAAITNFNDLFTWGRNKNYSLGLGNDKDQNFPLKVALGGLVENVFCGFDHTIALCKPFI